MDYERLGIGILQNIGGFLVLIVPVYRDRIRTNETGSKGEFKKWEIIP